MRHLRPAIVSLALFTLICGVIYPVLVTGIATLVFPDQARGSVIQHEGRAIGSELIAQGFTNAKYFWPRPSAAGYNGASSGGSNYGPTAPSLHDAVKKRIADLRAADPENTAPVPVDLVTASGSGLDPHISPAAARYQAARVARARSRSPEEIQAVIDQFTEARTFGVLGEPRVNVLKLNLALDDPETATTRPASQPTTTYQLYRWRGFLPE